MPLIKICGITNLGDALSCVDAGADMLGFNFYSGSHRYIPPVQARDIISRLPSKVLTVGVFVNAGSPEKVKQVADQTGITGVQLHGDEDPEYCCALSDRFVIKAFRVGPDFNLGDGRDYQVSAIMLDSFHSSLKGGTGQIFDWSVAVELSKQVPRLFLAGGLTSENVIEAISLVRPYAIDVCSSLEIGHGRKDLAAVRRFVDTVRKIERQLNPSGI